MRYSTTHWIHGNPSKALREAGFPEFTDDDPQSEVFILIPDNDMTMLIRLMQKFDVMVVDRGCKPYIYIDYKGKGFRQR
jgi:hypothetical protein